MDVLKKLLRLGLRPLQILKLNRLWQKLQRMEREMIWKALKSKTVWLGIISSAWGLVQAFMSAGDFSREAIVALVTGVAIIVLRAVTTTPLSDK